MRAKTVAVVLLLSAVAFAKPKSHRLASGFIGGNNVQGTVSTNGVRATTVTVPAAPVISGPAGSTQWCYEATALSGDPANPLFTTGEGVASSAGCLSGVATLSTTAANVVTITTVPGAVGYNVYRTTASGTPSTTGKIGSTYYAGAGATISFTDTGIAASGSAPSVDGTGQILYGSGSNIVPTITYLGGSAPTNIPAIEANTCTASSNLCPSQTLHFSSNTFYCVCSDTSNTVGACDPTTDGGLQVTPKLAGSTDVGNWVCFGNK